MIGAIAVVSALFLFVMAHEAGHFFAAKLTKMKVTEFFFGFGPRLFSFRRGETEYGVKLIPAGGYVRIVGMSPLEEVAAENVGRTYREKKFWEKSVVVLAGVAANFLIAYLILWGLFYVDGDRTFDYLAEVAEVIEGSPASMAGLETGDRILRVGDAEIGTWEDVREAVAARPLQEVEVVVDRGGEIMTLQATLARSPGGGDVGYLGVAAVVLENRVDLGLFNAAGVAGRWTGKLTQMTFEFLGKMVQPSNLALLARSFAGEEVPDDVRPVSLVGIAQVGSQADAIGIANVVYILAAINVVLGSLNALPIFPLDGGHFAVALYEKLSGRSADLRKLMPVAVAAIALFLFLGAVSLYLDLVQPIDFSTR